MTASDHTFASYRKPLDTGVSINGLNTRYDVWLDHEKQANTPSAVPISAEVKDDLGRRSARSVPVGMAFSRTTRAAIPIISGCLGSEE